MEELNAVLHKFNQNIVDVSRRISRDTLTCCMTQVILPLLEKVGEIDVRFRCTSPMPNEVYFSGMKSSCMNEFELTVILTDLLAAKTFEDGGCQGGNVPCYGRVLAQQAAHPLEDLLVEANSSHGVVSALRIRQMFAQLVSQAVQFLPVVGMSVEVSVKEDQLCRCHGSLDAMQNFFGSSECGRQIFFWKICHIKQEAKAR